MKIALVQMTCLWGELARNFAAMERFCEQARENRAEMVVFPELCVTGIYKDNRVWDLAEEAGGPSVQKLSEAAARYGLHLGFGFTERARPLPYNAYCVVRRDGSIAGVYRKNSIPKLEVPWWQGHGERPVFEVAGRRFGVSICWDTTQPELLADYGRQNAEVVLMPHAWDADPLGPDGKDLPHETMEELYEHQRSGRLAGWRGHDAMLEQFLGYIPARAREGRFHALFVNQSGQPHPAVRFAGPTFAVDPEGQLLASTRDGAEQAIYVEIA